MRWQLAHSYHATRLSSSYERRARGWVFGLVQEGQGGEGLVECMITDTTIFESLQDVRLWTRSKWNNSGPGRYLVGGGWPLP
jgi:hypothetical protein